MDLSSILKDSVKYPFSDWRKFLILGFIILIVNFSDIFRPNFFLNTPKIWIMWVLSIIGGLFLFLVKGYLIRIMKFSFTGMLKLPEFNNLVDMFIDGAKFFIVTFVYTIPIIFILLIFSVLSTSHISIFINILFGLAKWLIIGGTVIHDVYVWMGIWFFVIILYMILIIPIIAMAIAQIANNGKLNAAFKFKEIFKIITSKGWKYLISWYVVTVIFYLIFATVGIILTGYISKFNPLIGTVLSILIVSTYLYIYLARSVALFYIQSK